MPRPKKAKVEIKRPPGRPRKDDTVGPDHIPFGPWCQRSDEDAWKWLLFHTYLMMPHPRSYERLSAIGQIQFNGRARDIPVTGYIKRIAAPEMYDWQARVAAWDKHWNERALKQHATAVEIAQDEQNQRTVRLGQLVQNTAAQTLEVRHKRITRLAKQHAEAIEKGDWKEVERIENQIAEQAGMDEAARAAVRGNKLERLGLNMPTDNATIDQRVSGTIGHNHQGSVDLTISVKPSIIRNVLKQLSDDQLELLSSVVEKVLDMQKAEADV